MGATFFNGNFLKVLPTKGIELKDGTKIITGTGSPEGVETAPIGSWYTDTSNGDWYRKLSGSGNTGWVANTFNLLQDGSLSLPSLAFASNTGSGMFYVDTSTGLLWLTTDGKGRLGIGPSSTDIYAQTEELVAQFTTLGSTFPYGIYAPGAVLQVVSTTKTDTFSTSSTSFVDITGLQAAITPKSASSKILIIATVSGQHNTASNGFRIVRDSTPIGIGDAASARTQATASSLYIGESGAMAMGLPLLFQDAPASTSELIYKIQVNVSAGTVYINRNSSDGNASSNYRTTSTITVMEIGA